MNNETLKRDLGSRLIYGVKVQYEGILNGKERSKSIKEWNEKNKDVHFLESEPLILPDEIIGLKIATLKRITQYKKHWVAEAGIKQYKKFYNGKGLKPILFSTSCLTKPITVSTYNNGKPFVPIEEMANIGSIYYGGFEEAKFAIECLEAGLSHEMYDSWMVELLQKWHINYRLSPDQFIEATNEYE